MLSLKISIDMMPMRSHFAYSLQNQGLCGAQPVFEISANITGRYIMRINRIRQTHLRPLARIQSVRKFN
jgi:hypothetical protein